MLKSKDEGNSDVKDLKIKYENMKTSFQKEYQARKDKEVKLE